MKINHNYDHSFPFVIIDDYYDTTSFVSAIQKRQGFKIACLEEIALKKKWKIKILLKKTLNFKGICII